MPISRHPLIYTLPAAVLLSASLAVASDHREAHQHGYANLQLVVDGTVLSVMLTAPGNSLLGFEHIPSTEEERHQVEETTQWLQHTALINADNAGCTVTSVEVESGFGSEPDAHSGHDEHDEHEGGDHREFNVSQEIRCASLPDDGYWQSPLTGRFQHLHQLRVEWLSREGQGSARLSGAAPQFRMTP